MGVYEVEGNVITYEKFRGFIGKKKSREKKNENRIR